MALFPRSSRDTAPEAVRRLHRYGCATGLWAGTGWLLTRLQQASAAASARAGHFTEEEVDELIGRARSEVYQETSGG